MKERERVFERCVRLCRWFCFFATLNSNIENVSGDRPTDGRTDMMKGTMKRNGAGFIYWWRSKKTAAATGKRSVTTIIANCAWIVCSCVVEHKRRARLSQMPATTYIACLHFYPTVYSTSELSARFYDVSVLTGAQSSDDRQLGNGY